MMSTTSLTPTTTPTLNTEDVSMTDIKVGERGGGGKNAKKVESEFLEARVMQQRVLERIKKRVRDFFKAEENSKKVC